VNKDASKEQQPPFIPPVSVFAGPIAELVGHRLLSPPTRPGLLASLARYEVIRVLGGGGMGVVVLAHDAENGRDVAIKLIRPELVPEQRIVHRFVKEAGHLQKLKHPNVVPVLEVSDRAEGPYFVMPFFEQGSLAQRIRPGQPLDSETILDTSMQIAEGLAFAHRHGIIHRDLKPANILMGNDGKSCLADFGLARTMFNDSIIDVEREQLEGTAPYMSPGVAAGNAEDTRCDIYAFGALLYEMLTGEPPYAGRNTNDIRQQIMAGPPKPIRERNPEADAGLAAIAEGAMARELRDRYADMADVLADLERIKIGKSPQGPRGISDRAKKLPFSLWVPGGILLIAAGLWMIWSGGQSRKETISAPPITATNPASTPRILPAPQIVPSITTAPVVSPTVVLTNQWRVVALAGQPGIAGNVDGVGTAARFRSPEGIAVDNSGALYIADTGNNTVRKILSDGTVATIAGQGGKAGRTDGMGFDARFLAPLGIAVGPSGNVFVAEFANDIIRKISPDGVVSTLAGSAGRPGSDNGIGDNAHFRNPWGLAVDRTGNVFVADKDNFTIREITPTGIVSTFAGQAGKLGKSDGPGSYARFNYPHSVAVNTFGHDEMVYVADTGNCTIRAITPSGIVSTLAGSPGNPGSADGPGAKARFSNVQDVAVGGNGNIYVLDGDTVRKISRQGDVSTLPAAALTNDHGQTIRPTSLAVDQAGNLYFVESLAGVVWKSTPPQARK
jgi:serine/threonine protein kinase/sugar lactone lactonase YvrE